MTKEELEMLGNVQEIMKNLCDRKKGKRSVRIVMTEDLEGITCDMEMAYPPKSGDADAKRKKKE